jgi:hypothetical protein
MTTKKKLSLPFMLLGLVPVFYMSFGAFFGFMDYNPYVVLGMLLIILPYLELKKPNLGIFVPLTQLFIVLMAVYFTADFSAILKLAAGYLLIYPLFAIWLLGTETKVGSMLSIYISAYISSLFTYTAILEGKVDSLGVVGNLATPLILLTQRRGTAEASSQSYPPISYSTDVTISVLSALGTIFFLLYILRFSSLPVSREYGGFFVDLFSRGVFFIILLVIAALVCYTILEDYVIILLAGVSLGFTFLLRRELSKTRY